MLTKCHKPLHTTESGIHVKCTRALQHSSNSSSGGSSGSSGAIPTKFLDLVGLLLADFKKMSGIATC